MLEWDPPSSFKEHKGKEFVLSVLAHGGCYVAKALQPSGFLNMPILVLDT